MHLTRYILLLVMLSINFNHVNAKENKDLMKASYYYNHYAFYEAIPYYEKIAGEMNDPQIYARLADCYSVTNNAVKAAEAYAKAVNMKGCSSIVILRYAQLLMQLTKYDSAAIWLNEYLKTNKNDKRAINMIAGCNSAKGKLADIPEGAITLLPFNTGGSEYAPTRWKEKLVFASDTAIDMKKKTDGWSGRSYFNIYSISCDDRGHCNSDMEKLTESKSLNTKFHDGPCTFSGDGKLMYYTRSRCKDNLISKGSIANSDSTVLLEIMIAGDYDSASKKFRTNTPFEFNSKEYSVAHPAVCPNGNLMVFASNKPKGQGGTDLYLCRNVMGNWTKPVNAGNIINTEGEEVFPYWADDSTLFFSSDGHEGLGGLDIYKTTWQNASGTFSSPANIGTPINSSYDDISLCLYADGRSTYFSSNRPAPYGGDNIWFYKKEKIFLQLNITDSITRQPIPGVNLAITSMGAQHDTATDGSGHYFVQIYPEQQYSIKVTKESYPEKTIAFTATTNKDADTIIRNLSLYNPPPPVVKIADTVNPVPPASFVKIVGTPEVDKIYEIGHFYFAFNSAELSDSAKIVLDSLAGYLNTRPTMHIQVRSHTDCRGGDVYNMKLSNERALSVVNYLKNRGIKPNRLSYIGLGNREPKIPCPVCEQCNEEQYYYNRVLEFKVLQL